ncbi:MAG: hypothetical protein D6712_09240, partial [Chloroflexi bacterium]
MRLRTLTLRLSIVLLALLLLPQVQADMTAVVVLYEDDILNTTAAAVPYNPVPGVFIYSGLSVTEDASDNIAAYPVPPAPAPVPAGFGAWQSLEPPLVATNTGKIEIYFIPETILGTGSPYTIGDLRSITWYTYNDDPIAPPTLPNWYVNIWADAGGGRTAMLSGEPYWANNLNGAANTWLQWTADASGSVTTNEITFHETRHACTQFGWAAGGGVGPMATLQDLTTAPFTWNNVPSQTWFGGAGNCTGTPNPLTTTIDYRPMTIYSISFGTGSGWAANFDGWLDGMEIVLDDGSGGEDRIFIDLEVDLPAEPQIDKSFSPATVNINQNSTLAYTITNTNTLDGLSGIAFSDNTGLTLGATFTVGGDPNCIFRASDVTIAGGTITVSNGYVPPDATCTLRLTASSPTAGVFTSTTSAVTSPTSRGG